MLGRIQRPDQTDQEGSCDKGGVDKDALEYLAGAFSSQENFNRGDEEIK